MQTPSTAKIVKNSPRPRIVFAVVLAILVVAGYLIASQAVYGLGFPLDDAWIHQTYARNLAFFGEWSFIPGQPSAGSTAPLWSMLLSMGYLVRLNPYIWTYLLGAAALAALVLTGEMWSRSLSSDVKTAIPWAGLFLAGEWHLGWAAASGMETILFALAILLVFYLLRTREKGWLPGLVIGLSIWIRPDGVTLLGPAIFQVLLDEKTWRERLVKGGEVLLPVALLSAAYLGFTHAVSGSWLPNTFFAKQAEYAVYQQNPLYERFFSLFVLPLIGAGLFLLPGFVFTAWKAIQRRHWNVLGAILWWLGYTLVYAVRLPVTYQHGRYLIPAMAVYFVIGLTGTLDMTRDLKLEKRINLKTLEKRKRWARLAAMEWIAGLTVLWGVMIFVGAMTYAQDVAIIDTEMVNTAQWVAANTPENAVIAAHDIGALGYYGKRKILDLAGLVTPEVIPFIRDEKKLADYLNENRAAYLMTFPGWYPGLVKDLSPIYQSNGKFSPAAGGENMAVYLWK